MRETLFNWLGQDLSAATTLEPYAGTGVLSLEALSRGASLAVAVDRNPALIDALKATARKIGVDGLETHTGDALRHLRTERRVFDVVFLDPPFGEDLLDRALELAAPLISADGFLYVESGESLDTAGHAALEGWAVVRQGKAGAVHYHLLQRENEE